MSAKFVNWEKDQQKLTLTPFNPNSKSNPRREVVVS